MTDFETLPPTISLLLDFANLYLSLPSSIFSYLTQSVQCLHTHLSFGWLLAKFGFWFGFYALNNLGVGEDMTHTEENYFYSPGVFLFKIKTLMI